MDEEDDAIAEQYEFKTTGLAIDGEDVDDGMAVYRVVHGPYGTDRALYLSIPFELPSPLLDRIKRRWIQSPPPLQLTFDGPSGKQEYRVTNYRFYPAHGGVQHLQITLSGDEAEQIGVQTYEWRKQRLSE